MPYDNRPGRTADRLIDAMKAAGVRVLFSLSGNQIMPIYDALIGSDIRLIHSRHEAAAVFMAEAYARTSEQLGVALVTAGPGFGNALGPLFSVSKSETPVILISGDSPIAGDGLGAFQEFDQVAAATPFVKASLRVQPDIDIAEVFAMAAQIACQGTPGPVHIALPQDVIEKQVDVTMLADLDSLFANSETGYSTIGSVSVEPESLEPLSALIRDSARPVIVCGPALGRKRFQEARDQLSVTAGAPVIVLDSPRGLRDPAKGALRTLLTTADCLIYLGKSVDFMTGLGSAEAVSATRIAIIADSQAALDHASDVFTGRLKIAERLQPAAAIGALTMALHNQPWSGQRKDRGKQWLARSTAALCHRELDKPDASALLSKQLVETIARFIAERPDTIVICDGGEIGQWAQGFIGVNHMITNGPSGAIGAALPYAIGSSLAAPDAPVLAIMGDGTVGFHFSEFETAAREGLDITVVIGNDSKWNAEHQLQINQYGEDRTMGCELGKQVRYDVSAEGLGCKGIYVADLTTMSAALQQAADTPGPGCINVIIPGASAPVYKPFSFQ